ncbi:UbiA family prenyltransferase [Candidatus Nanohalobium constans]|uniref:UbiA family prenyltransferase n=1 Tax=Candidatus Nanohalobium constans TaxID=2565781 RepID=UPI001C3E1FE2|nr:UbiA family prenyltransferase [Candidatus Nanohalobium constans]
MEKSELLLYIKTFIGLCRPIGIPIGIITMLAAIVSANGFSLSILPIATLVTLVSFYVGFAPNDYFDSETDENNPRKGGIQGEVVDQRKEMIAKWVTIFSIISAFILSLILPRTASIALIILTILSLMYSAPPIRLKGRPFLDSFVNFLMAYATFAIGVGLTGASFSDIIPGAMWFSLIYGGGGHALAAVMDYQPDKRADITTIAVESGKKIPIALFQLSILLALALEAWSQETKIFLLLTFHGLTLAALKPQREHIERLVYIGTAIMMIYGTIWIYLRI